MSKFPKITAHTGCMNTQNNSIESALEGIKAGADLIEVDVRVTKDGIAILYHDDSPYISACTYEELNQLEMRKKLDPVYSNREIVRLEQLFQETREYDILFNLDIKTKEAVGPVIEVMEKLKMADRVYFTGCTEEVTIYRDRVVWNTPDLLSEADQKNYPSYAEGICRELMSGGYYGLNMNYVTCLPEMVECAHALNLAVWVYTVDDLKDMKEAIRIGVDAITTNEVNSLFTLKIVSQ